MAGIAIIDVFTNSYIGTCGSVNLKNSIILKAFVNTMFIKYALQK